MNNKKIAFIGAGNMASAMIKGVVESQMILPQNIYASRRSEEALNELKVETNINVSTNNVEIVKKADVVVLGVKPYMIFEILTEIKPFIKPDTIVISLAVGISAEVMYEFLQIGKLYAAMCNTAIKVRESMTCISGANADVESNNYVKALFQLVGQAEFLEPSQIDAASVVSSCNTAYVMRFIRANTTGAVSIGLKADIAKRISAQTVKGAAEIILKEGTQPEDEIDKVCTPAGTTIAGLVELEKNGFSNAIVQCFKKAYERVILNSKK
jgi:pyrroline-5-carboxylate reductase